MLYDKIDSLWSRSMKSLSILLVHVLCITIIELTIIVIVTGLIESDALDRRALDSSEFSSEASNEAMKPFMVRKLHEPHVTLSWEIIYRKTWLSSPPGCQVQAGCEAHTCLLSKRLFVRHILLSIFSF